MLLPAKSEVRRLLRRYRLCERATVAAPADLASRAAFEDSGYTLCVLMGERTPREAAEAARRYLRTDLVTYLRERNGRIRAASVGRRPRRSTSRTQDSRAG
ncbi:DUF5133 domain-containing protein [Streptomyces sp. NPDC001817]|uniref:DUF5133 domain-containing protein n=1 Tax=Streptomyces sp. NPDC001817 TaxID=3154398 RepID=UPI00333299E1